MSPRPSALAPDEIERRLEAHPRWRFEGGQLRRALRFADFSEAFAFMTRVAIEAEKRDHHPEWSNVYDRVEIALVTHDQSGITDLDFDLAGAIDRLATTDRAE